MGAIEQKNHEALLQLTEAAAAPAAEQPSLDGDRVLPKPGKVLSIPTARPAGMLQESGEGWQSLFVDWLRSRLQSWHGKARKTLLGNPG